MTFAPPLRIFAAQSQGDALPSAGLLLHVTFASDFAPTSFYPAPLLALAPIQLDVTLGAAAEVVLPSLIPLLAPPEPEKLGLAVPLAAGAPAALLTLDNAEPPVTHLSQPQTLFTPVLAIADQALPLLESVGPILPTPDFTFMQVPAAVPSLPQIPRVNFATLVPLPERQAMPADPAALLATFPAIPQAPAPALPSLPWPNLPLSDLPFSNLPLPSLPSPNLPWLGLHLPIVPIPPPLLADWML